MAVIAALLLPHCSINPPSPAESGLRHRCRNNKELCNEYELDPHFFGWRGTVLIDDCLPRTWRAESGIASIYSTESGTGTASGQKLNPSALTAAHKTLPFGTKVRVTNHKNGKTIVVTINDRGPFVRGRIIDLTPAGARALGFSGLAPVTVEIEG